MTIEGSSAVPVASTTAQTDIASTQTTLPAARSGRNGSAATMTEMMTAEGTVSIENASRRT